MNLQEASDKLSKYGQEHVLKYYEELNQDEKDNLLKQISETDFSVTDKVSKPSGGERGVISPIKQ